MSSFYELSPAKNFLKGKSSLRSPTIKMGLIITGEREAPPDMDHEST